MARPGDQARVKAGPPLMTVAGAEAGALVAGPGVKVGPLRAGPGVRQAGVEAGPLTLLVPTVIDAAPDGTSDVAPVGTGTGEAAFGGVEGPNPNPSPSPKPIPSPSPI